MKDIVVFRKFKDGQVIAIFPMIKYNDELWLCMSYMKIGQHSACHFNIVFETSKASIEEYTPLYNELVNDIGYDLEVKQKICRKWSTK